MTIQASKFNERLAFWTARTSDTASALRAMAHDVELAPYFDQADVAAIVGVEANTVKCWRARKQGPAHVSISYACVRYPRAEFCFWLAERHAREAA
ncbi:MAG: hypothetical protein KDE63_09405 [Novosphingobium sp.]|nr:hypothetical protein [Novosphingobium sp.]